MPSLRYNIMHGLRGWTPDTWFWDQVSPTELNPLNWHKRHLPNGNTLLKTFFVSLSQLPTCPTVLPPSQAKRRPTFNALEKSNTVMLLSPGITISTPSGRLMFPVTLLYVRRTVDGSYCGMAGRPPFFFQDIHLSFKLSVWVTEPGLQITILFDIRFLDTSQ